MGTQSTVRMSYNGRCQALNYNPTQKGGRKWKRQVCRCGENLAQQARQGNSRFWTLFPENQEKLGTEEPGNETS